MRGTRRKPPVGVLTFFLIMLIIGFGMMFIGMAFGAMPVTVLIHYAKDGRATDAVIYTEDGFTASDARDVLCPTLRHLTRQGIPFGVPFPYIVRTMVPIEGGGYFGPAPEPSLRGIIGSCPAERL